MATRLRSFLNRAALFFNLITLAMGAYLMAGIINTFFANGLREPPSWPSILPEIPATGPPLEQALNNRIIVERNYFGSAMATLPPPPPPEQATRVVPSRLRASLIGTIVADDPAWSMSMVIDLTRSETGIYRVGDTLMGEAMVVEVQARKIYVVQEGVLQYLVLGEEEDHGPAADEYTEVSAMREGSRQTEGIQRTGPSHWRIDRRELENAVLDLKKIAGTVHIRPNLVGDEMRGFKLLRIRPGSVFSRLGFQNGDAIEKINGYTLGSPEILLEIYKKLHKASQIEVELSRGDAPITHSYTIF